jgi:small-conductance mechanosensitive channel
VLASGDSLYDLFRRLNFSDFAARSTATVLGVALVVVGAFVVSQLASRAAHRSVESLVARSTLPGAAARSTGRAQTLGGVAASMVRIVVWSVAVLMVLDELGINLGPFLAGASIVGVALGFGAQSLVKDFLSGFFILAEDQFGVGDVITVSDTTGTVEEVNLRVTRLRATDGTVWFVPNGEIRTVGNADKEWSRAIVDVIVPADADVAVACAAISRELEGLAGDADWSASVLEPPVVLGVEAMGPDGTTVRVAAKTAPGERARVARDLRARILARLRTEGILPAQKPS